MRAFKKNLILVFVFILSFIVPYLTYRAIDKQVGKNKTSNKQESTPIVHIVSVPPEQAVMGKVWQYGVSIKNLDPTKYNIVVKKPSWLVWDKGKLLLKGEVPTNIDSFQVEIELLDKNNKVIDKQTVNVKVVDSVSNLKPEFKVATLQKGAIKSRFTDTGINKASGAQAVLGVKTNKIPRTGIIDNVVLGLISALGFTFIGIRVFKRKHTSSDIQVAVIKGTIQ